MWVAGVGWGLEVVDCEMRIDGCGLGIVSCEVWIED